MSTASQQQTPVLAPFPYEQVVPPATLLEKADLQDLKPGLVSIEVLSPSLKKETSELQSNPPGTNLLTCSYQASWLMGVCWSPDSSRIASASDDKTVQMWDAMTGRRILTYNGHTKAVTGVSWSPDGSRIASASLDKTVQVWQAK